MNYQFKLPHPALKDVVIRYWEGSFPASHNPGNISVKLPAIAGQEIFFNLMRPFQTNAHNGTFEEVPRSYIVSHTTKPVILKCLDHAFAIHLHHTAGYRLWGLPMSEMTNNPVSLEGVLGTPGGELIEKINLAKDFAERTRIADEFLLKTYFNSNRETPIVDFLLKQLKANDGFIKVRDMAIISGFSHKQFNRRFFERVGLTPKTYSNILRTNFLIGHISQKEEADWQELIYKYNYFDQSHLIKNFTRLTGMSPVEYFNTNKDQFPKYVVANRED